jgi:hypothetical protein
MLKKLFDIKMILVFTMVFLLSCKNDQQDKQVADSTKILAGGGVDTTKRLDTSGFKKDNIVAASPAIKKDSSNISSSKTKSSTNKKTNSGKHDTLDAIKSSIEPVAKNDVTVNKNVTPPPVKTETKVDPNAPFVSKYGTIPRNATTSNVTSFFTAFPDKSTLIKINFDGPADAEMTGVKTQIIKVLRSSGYTNVQDQSATIEPKRMPKEIHYELQRDGSVILWVPVANTDQ